MARKKIKLSRLSIALILGIFVVIIISIFGASGNIGELYVPAMYKARMAAYDYAKTSELIFGNTRYAIFNVLTPFPVDAWGNSGWDDCSSMSGGNDRAVIFCGCKGYANVYNNGKGSCYKESSKSRWNWVYDSAPTCGEKSGNNTGSGLAVTKIKCYNAYSIGTPEKVLEAKGTLP